MDSQSIPRSRIGIAGLILCAIIFLIYSNSFNAAWQFDDLPNITLNPHMHLEQLSTDDSDPRHVCLALRDAL